VLARIALPLLLAASAASWADDAVEWNAATYRIVLASDEADGKSGMFTVDVAQPGGPPLHVHADADEYFYVLEGTTRFRIGERSIVRRAGEVAYVPRGTEHSYRIESETGGRMLVIVTPGGFERFFEAMAAESLVIPDDMPRITEIARQFELTFTGPPLAPD
jgi:quercetin dioxygenase-like cupin family protein